MTKTFDVIQVRDDLAVVVDKDADCPKGSWAVFTHTRNDKIVGYDPPIRCKWDYAANGLYNLRVIATIGVPLKGLPVVKKVKKVKSIFCKDDIINAFNAARLKTGRIDYEYESVEQYMDSLEEQVFPVWIKLCARENLNNCLCYQSNAPDKHSCRYYNYENNCTRGATLDTYVGSDGQLTVDEYDGI